MYKGSIPTEKIILSIVNCSMDHLVQGSPYADTMNLLQVLMIVLRRDSKVDNDLM